MSEQDEQTTEKQVPDLGGALRRAREEKGFELAEVASKLRVAKQKLIDLEANEFEKVGPSIFVKGYVKSYSKLLDLDYPSLMQDFPDDEADQTEALMQSFSRRTEQEAHDSRLMFVSYIILAIIIGSSALWWWQSSDKNFSFGSSSNEQTEPAQQVETPQESEQGNETQRLDTRPGVEQASTGDVQLDQPLSAEQAQAVNAVQQEAVQQEGLQSDEPEALEQGTQESTTEQQQEPVEAPTQALVESSEGENQAEQTLAPGEQRVEMRFTAQSWVEVNDAEGERLVYDIKEPGEHITLVGKAPFSVILGKHDVVAITVNGEAVDISHFPKNRLAKFKLPLTE